MADDRIDWADVAAVGMVARDWFDDFREKHCVRALLAHESPAFCRGLSVYQPNVDRIAAALREAHEAGLREGRRERARFTPAETADLMLMVRDVVEAQYAAIREENRALREEVTRLRRELGVHSE